MNHEATKTPRKEGMVLWLLPALVIWRFVILGATPVALNHYTGTLERR